METKSEEIGTPLLSANKENEKLMAMGQLQISSLELSMDRGRGSGSGAEHEQNPRFGVTTRCGSPIRARNFENTTRSS